MPSNYLARIHLSCLCCNQRDFDTPRRSLIYTRREAAFNLRKATRSTQKKHRVKRTLRLVFPEHPRSTHKESLYC